MNTLQGYIKVLLIFAFAVHVLCANDSSGVQYMFALSNVNGVPYSIEDEDYFIPGFEVDSSGNFWFLGGDTATLVKATNEGGIQLRQKYSAFTSNSIGILFCKLYVFEDQNNRNELFTISVDSGKILQKYKQIFTNKVNSIFFRENGIVFELLFVKPPYDASEMLKYVLYSYDGKFSSGVPNKSGLDSSYNSLKFDYYLGMYEGYPLIVVFDYDKNQFHLGIVDVQGRAIKKSIIDEKYLGDPFYGAPEEHWCRRGDKLFVLRQKNNMAIITDLTLSNVLK